jgi:hypothetical protein
MQGGQPGPQGSQGQAAQGPTTNNACFHCRQVGHFIWSCPQKQGRRSNNYANLIDFNLNKEAEMEEQPMPQQSKVATLWAQLEALTKEDKDQLAKEMGVTKDFHLAWLEQP